MAWSLIQSFFLGGNSPAPVDNSGGLVPPTGFVFITRQDGTYLQSAPGVYLIKAAP